MNLEMKFWAVRRHNKVGPFSTREDALQAFRTKHPYVGPAYAMKALRNAIMTGYGENGPHTDIRWHHAGEE